MAGSARRSVAKIREDIESRNALPMMPMRKNRNAVDMAIYTVRNIAERCFSKLKSNRRLAAR